MTRGLMRLAGAAVAMGLALGSTRAAASGPASEPLELHRTRFSDTDLAVSGLVAGIGTGETRYVRWADLRAQPTHRLKLAAEFFPGEQEVTVIFLDELRRALPVAVQADTVLARCADGYASIYRDNFVAECRPFLVLEINGLGPEKWPPPGLQFNPAPYVISVSAAIAPPVARLLDPGHKKPWGVTSIEFARLGDIFHDTYTGRWANLSARASAGREIWINSCASCHPGPGAALGGTKSGQPFRVLEVLARYDADFFKTYVRRPKSVNPMAQMEAHPHYSDAQLDELVAFVSAEQTK